MMVHGFIGIDVSKDTFTVAFLLVDSSQQTVLHEEVHIFSYNQAGWKAFLETWNLIPAHSWYLGLEASGPYSKLLEAHLQNYCLPRHISLFRLPPAQVCRFAQGRSLRRTKTDRLDARTLARFLWSQLQQKASLTHIQPDGTAHTMVRLECQLLAELNRLQNRLRQLLHFLFPELERALPRIPKALRRVLTHYPSAQAIAQADPAHLDALLHHSRGGRSSWTAQHLQELAKNSLGLHDPHRAFALQCLLAQWDFLEQQLSQVRRNLHKWAQKTHPQALVILRSIPGVGPLMATRFMALVGSVHRFPSPKTVVAYAGLDPTVYLSGHFKGRSRLSKRGHPTLRHLLFLMANTLKRRTHRFREEYHRYRSQGRAHRETLVILSRKALTLCWHLLMRQSLFQDQAFALIPYS